MIKTQKNITIAATLPMDIYDKLKKSAKENDRSISKEVKRIISFHLEAEQEEKKKKLLDDVNKFSNTGIGRGRIPAF